MLWCEAGFVGWGECINGCFCRSGFGGNFGAIDTVLVVGLLLLVRGIERNGMHIYTQQPSKKLSTKNRILNGTA